MSISKLKIVTLILGVAVMALPPGVWATHIGPFSGELNTEGTVDGLITGTDGWSSGVSFSWTVTHLANGNWFYEYWFEAEMKELSHVNIEVSDDFTEGDIIEADPSFSSLQTHTTANGNPGIPDPLYGIKWETNPATTMFHFNLETPRAPVWGDFYAKDGGGTGPGAVIAYNTGFTASDTDPDPTLFPASEGSVGNHILVPDTTTTVIPEPRSIVAIAAIGLLSLAGFIRRRKMRAA
jgi:hypothetical protein